MEYIINKFDTYVNQINEMLTNVFNNKYDLLGFAITSKNHQYTLRVYAERGDTWLSNINSTYHEIALFTSTDVQPIGGVISKDEILEIMRQTVHSLGTHFRNFVPRHVRMPAAISQGKHYFFKIK